ncbi:MAG: RNA-binding protein [Rhodobacteraceae bacterium]|nr:RNA-binding protein [Paracoccaceae bacterium]
MSERQSSTKGFKQASSLLTSRIREVSETRGFAQSRLLTHWEEIAGKDTAKVSWPVKVSYGKQGFGATLLLLCNGANALFIEMEKERIRKRVNSVYGYNAIKRIKITQTSANGFEEALNSFTSNKRALEKLVDSKVAAKAQKLGNSVNDPEFARALEALAQNVLSKCKT